MSTLLMWGLLMGSGLLFAVLPFVVFMGLGAVLGVSSTDIRMRAAYCIAAVVLSYAVSLGVFSLLQKSNCKEVKNFKQISLNSLISAGITVAFLALLALVPWFKNVVLNLTPPDMDPSVRDSIAYGYYGFWAMAFSVALGGTLSSSCGTDMITPKDLFGLPTVAPKQGTSTAGAGANAGAGASAGASASPATALPAFDLGD